jgi:2,4-dienoyl-CoA reductase-like NADH-dependent reductase (Old Yellow Enzyme family)
LKNPERGKIVSRLFEETTIKGLTIPNRFIRSATWTGMAAADGACTRQLTDCMVRLASGGVGLIITGHAYVSAEGQAGSRQLGVYRDDLVAGLAEMTAAVHAAGGKIVLQLAHAGCQANTKLSGQEALGPSVLNTESGPMGREMTREEIRRVVDAFGQGAVRAEKAGFDGVQIHAAHGYLLSQYLSPFFNKRSDAYGGSLENRLRIVLEVFQGIKGRVGTDFPVMIKMNAEDFVPGGLSADEALHVATVLAEAGIDAIELSGGTPYSGKRTPVRVAKLESPDDEVFYLHAAGAYKKRVTAPLMLVGGIRSFEVAERLVDHGTTDYVSLSRPLIREPDLINRWKSGDLRKAACISDNGCFKPAVAGKGIYCVVERREKRKRR